MIHLIIYIALLGFAVYLLITFVPMAKPFQILIYVIAAICVLYLLMNAFGLSDIPVPSLRR